jgi:hypothetical protein
MGLSKGYDECKNFSQVFPEIKTTTGSIVVAHNESLKDVLLKSMAIWLKL